VDEVTFAVSTEQAQYAAYRSDLRLQSGHIGNARDSVLSPATLQGDCRAARPLQRLGSAEFHVFV
jgi:hypothetical protein